MPAAGLSSKLVPIVMIAAATWPGTALAQRPLGVDVSYWQGTPTLENWTSVHDAGRTFAFARCTHYSQPPESDAHGNPDPTFPTNMGRARAAGLLIGAYHYARPSIRDPQTEADFFVFYATQYWTQYAPDGPNFISSGYLRPVLDLEDGSSSAHVGAASLSDWAAAWMDAVKLQTGIEPMIYCSGNYANQLSSSFAARTLWFANWTCPSNPNTANPSASMYPWPNPGGWTFWQYCGGPVPGLPGNVDLDVFNGTTATLQNYVIVTPPLIVLNPTTLIRTVAPGSNLASDTFTVANDNSVIRATLNYTISENVSWISNVAPPSGASSGAANTHTITYATSSLARGHYSGAVTVTDPNAFNNPQQLTVDLTVLSPGDTDDDGDADPTDFGFLQACLDNPAVIAPPACVPADFNRDTHVDQNDVTIFIKCVSGANIAVISGCDA